ncbi:MAG: flippase [Bacillota bacterium]|nr:flippase [Bacillota bacterium]
MNKIAKNFLSTGVANIAGQVFLFLITAYYARLIGADSFGFMSLANQIIMYFTTIAIFGMQVYGTRIISSDKKEVNNIVGEVIGFRLFVAFCCFCFIVFMGLFLGRFIEGNYKFTLIQILYAASIFPVALSLDWVFNGLQEMHYNAVFTLCKYFIPGIIILILLKGQNNMYWIPISNAIGLTVGTGFQYCIYLKKQKYKFNLLVNWNIIKKYLYVGLPVLVQGLLGMVNNNVDKIIMGFSRPKAELGVYQASYTFISFLISIDALIFTPIFPLLADYFHNNNKVKLKQVSNEIAKIVSIVAMPVLVGGIILAKDIMYYFFRSKGYEAGYLPLSILLIYIFILFIREVFAYQLNAWDMEKKYLKIIALSAILNFTLNIIFIPRYGMIGAAWVTTITEIINLFLMRKAAFKVIRTNILSSVIKPIGPTIIMAAVIVLIKYLKINMVINIFAAVIAYFSLIILLKIITISEIRGFILKREK